MEYQVKNNETYIYLIEKRGKRYKTPRLIYKLTSLNFRILLKYQHGEGKKTTVIPSTSIIQFNSPIAFPLKFLSFSEQKAKRDVILYTFTIEDPHEKTILHELINISYFLIKKENILGKIIRENIGKSIVYRFLQQKNYDKLILESYEEMRLYNYGIKRKPDIFAISYRNVVVI